VITHMETPQDNNNGVMHKLAVDEFNSGWV